MNLIIWIILILLIIAVFPTWPYSREWGYYPSGSILLLVIILAILALYKG